MRAVPSAAIVIEMIMKIGIGLLIDVQSEAIFSLSHPVHPHSIPNVDRYTIASIRRHTHTCPVFMNCVPTLTDPYAIRSRPVECIR